MDGKEYVDKRNKMLAERVIKGLETRNMEGYFVSTKQDALKKALELIPEGSTVAWGGSMSTEAIGLNEAVIKGNYTAIDRHSGKTPEESEELTRKGLVADYFLMSTNAIAEDGILVNVDGNANRVAALCYGPKYVIMVVGMNKIVRDEQEAMMRARYTAAPINACRFPGDTPCRKTGVCANCLSPDTICCQIVTTRYSKIKGRIKVILVEEDLGF